MRARTKALVAAGVLALALAGCGGGTSVSGEYEGVLQDPDGEERSVTLEIEQRNDGSLRAFWSTEGGEREIRLTGDEPIYGQFSLAAEPGSGGGYETIIDGQVTGDELEADFFASTMRAPVTAERQ